MVDINLLPEEFRSKDNAERNDSKKKPIKVEVHLTSPGKSKDITSKKGFWKKIFPGDGGINTPKDRHEKEIISEPAKKKVTHIKSTSESVMHVPEKSDKAEKRPMVLSVDKEEKNNKEGRPLINPHMSDFKKESEIKDAQDKEVKSIPVLHKPTSEPVKDVDIKKVSKHGVPQITFDEPGKGDEDRSGIGKMVEGVRDAFYKVVRKKAPPRIAVNLMPERHISLKDINWSRIVHMLVLSIGGAAGITIIWYLVLLDQERQGQLALTDLNGEIRTLQVEISRLRDEQKEALQLKNKLDIVETLLSEHVYWTQLLTLIENLTLDGVYFEGFTAALNSDSSITLSGSADTLETIFWQRETFSESEFIDMAEIENTSTGSVEEDALITFTLQLIVKPEIWKK